MTASRFDSSTHSLCLPTHLVLLVLLAACRGGLPPEPPGADPADARATTPVYNPPVNPYETSAFAGEKAQPAGGMDHSGMNHSGMNHGAMDHAGHSMNGDTAPGKAPAPAAAPHSNHKPESPR